MGSLCLIFDMVPVERIELPISRLQGECIATVLHRHDLATVKEVESLLRVLETLVLPLHHTVSTGGP